MVCTHSFRLYFGKLLGRHLIFQRPHFTFATLASVVSYQMFTKSRKDEALTIIQNPLLNFSPFFIGIFSSMMGIGGGNLSVPIMSYMGIEIRKAIGTSSALGIVIAVPGSIGFMISGQAVENLPDYSIGYVNLLYAALIIPLTILLCLLESDWLINLRGADCKQYLVYC